MKAMINKQEDINLTFYSKEVFNLLCILTPDPVFISKLTQLSKSFRVLVYEFIIKDENLSDEWFKIFSFTLNTMIEKKRKCAFFDTEKDKIIVQSNKLNYDAPIFYKKDEDDLFFSIGTVISTEYNSRARRLSIKINELKEISSQKCKLGCKIYDYGSKRKIFTWVFIANAFYVRFKLELVNRDEKNVINAIKRYNTFYS